MTCLTLQQLAPKLGEDNAAVQTMQQRFHNNVEFQADAVHAELAHDPGYTHYLEELNLLREEELYNSGMWI